ncbi:hypothetical protein LIER_18202 [Lithospermum erythrorhizon]|uniref:Uncharacterized protein n=1 Tax=Lithospermum erythrorhizon TaxID=34254 RepID=A0AAV3QFN3_LITER
MFQQKQDNDLLHEFLCGITKEKFGTLWSSSLSQDPPPTLDRAYDAMLQEEQLQGSKDFAVSDVVLTMAVPPPPRGTSRFESRPKCTFCNRLGHDISTCFSKHGFPDGWGRGTGRGSTAGAGSVGVAEEAGLVRLLRLDGDTGQVLLLVQPRLVQV